jgi:hypothetical protein
MKVNNNFIGLEKIDIGYLENSLSLYVKLINAIELLNQKPVEAAIIIKDNIINDALNKVTHNRKIFNNDQSMPNSLDA